MVISQRSQGQMRTDCWAIEAQTGITYIAVALLVTFHILLFQPQAFSLSQYEKFCLHSLTKFVQKRDFEQLCVGQIETSTSPPPPSDGHLTPLPSREKRIWLSESSRGWGIWTAPSISCEISGVASCRGGRGVRGFSWKRLCLWGQLVTSFVPYLKVFKFWYF